MMISPEVYIDSLKDYTLQQLYKERDELIQAIKYYEEGKFEEKEVFTIPSPETVYKYNKDEYLPRLEILIAKKEQNNFVSFKMDNYTNFYLKISRKKDFQYDPYDRWCDVSISISNKVFNYNNKGELLLEFEVIELRNLLKDSINGKITGKEKISFIEPDLEFDFSDDGYMDLKINLFEEGALSPNYHSQCFNREEIKKIYDYILTIFPEEEIKNEENKEDSQDKYYYITVKYDEYNNGKTYCYIADDTSIKVGDKVVVYMADSIVIATVVETQFYNKENAPYPVEKTKRVVEKVTENTDLSKYDLYYEEFDDEDDEYVSVKELAQKEKEINKLHKIILAVKEEKLSIKRLMNLLPMKNKYELYIIMYYSARLNLFINKVASDFYMLPEYDANLFSKKEYKELINGAVIVPRKLYENADNTEEIYQDAINFCKTNNIDYIDDYKKESE